MRRVGTVLGLVVAGCGCAFALNPSLDVIQYAHTAWTVREGSFNGHIYALAQTSDGYLSVGTEFGLFRFDGVRHIPVQPPAGQRAPASIFRLLSARDGTLWIGAFGGLFTWNGSKLTPRPEFDGQFVLSLLEDHEGTMWVGSLGHRTGRLCAMRTGGLQCYGDDGTFGNAVTSLYEDNSGNLWAGAQSGFWRWKPGAPKRYTTRPVELTAITQTDGGRLLVALYGGEVRQLARDKLEPYPIGAASNPNKLLRDRDVDSNKLLSDRDGGLWIGTVDRGLIHVHQGRTDVFSRSDGLSGDVVLCIFEDREGNVWVGTTGGLDRFRELPVTTISAKQGLSSDATNSVVTAADGSIWVAAGHSLTRWKNGQTRPFRHERGMPDDTVQSLFRDDGGRIWCFTPHRLAYVNEGRFVTALTVPDRDVHFISGDKAGNVWLSGDQSLVHLLKGRIVEQIPWSTLGRNPSAEVLLSDEHGGVWLGFWDEGGVLYLKDGQIRASYTAEDGLGEGVVPDLRFDRDGALWAATHGGLSRLKDGRIATLTSRNGLPCDTVHWTMEDDDRAFWLYTACGLVRITRTELEAWIADPRRRIETAVWDAADGVRLRSVAASGYGPRAVKSNDGKLWWVTGEGVQVVDPRHLTVNKLPPPVRIEQVKADGEVYQLEQGMHLAANVRDVWVNYTALSLVAPEKVHFKYKLEGQDEDWKEVINDRQAKYTNLTPRHYRFRVIASNNSGVWNATGDTLEFSVDPAFYQTNSFYALCAIAFSAVIWAIYHVRLRQLAHEFNVRIEERLDERTRIARELHDTLLQSFQGSLVQMQAARNLVSRQPERAAQTLDVAITLTENAVAEGRDAIQALRPKACSPSELPRLLSETGQEFAHSREAAGDAVRFRVTVEGRPEAMDPLAQEEIYSMARELLRNAFQHAQANEIEAEIRYEDGLIRLCIRDNGKGIDPIIVKSGGVQGHWGLVGVHERAERIGARVDFWTEAGVGTEVELTVPKSIAHGPNSRRRWLRMFRKGMKS